MANVHSSCLGRWLENRITHDCDICHYPIQQQVGLKKLSAILQDVLKLTKKKLRKDKFLLFKIVIYSAYLYFRRKGIDCIRWLLKELKKKFTTTIQTIVCVVYLIMVSTQLCVFSTNEVRYMYKSLKH